MSQESQITQVAIVGAGATGLVMALSLAKLGHRVTLIGKPDTRKSGRTVALFEGSLRLLKHLDLWQTLEPLTAQLSVMRIIDDTASLFRSPPANFNARELGLDAFGANIENSILVRTLQEAVEKQPLIHFEQDFVQSYDFKDDFATLALASGKQVQARLVVAADGVQSPARQAAGITLKKWDYPQTALTCLLQHKRPHNDTSTEFHTRQGPFTLVPLPPTPEAQHRSSLVWMMTHDRATSLSKYTPENLAREIEDQAQSFLGKMTLETPAFLFPMRGFTASSLTAPRLALVGEAAHAFPPIGAQGLNLGLRDVAHLVDAIEPALAANSDPSAPNLLKAYDDSRHGDIETRSRGVDFLNRSLLAQLLPVDALRGAGLLAISNFAPLRKLIMSTGLMPHGKPPSLMRPFESASL